MGVIYAVAPVDAKMTAWLKKEGVELPRKRASSRLPTPAELRSVAASLPKIRAEVSETAAGRLEHIILSSRRKAGPWTMLVVHDHLGEDQPCHALGFEKGWTSLIVEVLVQLARHTGPLALVPDTGHLPLVVTATSKVEELLATWEDDQ